VQTRWSNIAKETFAIYWALKKLDDLLGGIAFIMKTDHRNLLYMNNHGSRKAPQWKLDIDNVTQLYRARPKSSLHTGGRLQQTSRERPWYNGKPRNGTAYKTLS